MKEPTVVVPVAVEAQGLGPDGFHITVHLALVNGRVEVVGMDLAGFVRLDDGPAPFGRQWRPLTSDDLRAVRIADVRRHAIDQLRKMEEARQRVGGDDHTGEAYYRNLLSGSGLEGPELDAYVEKMVRSDEGWSSLVGIATAPTEHGALGPDHFLDVAVTYSEAWTQQLNPTAAVRDRWEVAPRTAARWVERARNEYGFLVKTEQRKPNGRLTAKAKRRLAGRQEREG